MPTNPAELITLPEILDLFFSFNFFPISTELDPELGPTLPLLVRKNNFKAKSTKPYIKLGLGCAKFRSEQVY